MDYCKELISFPLVVLPQTHAICTLICDRMCFNSPPLAPCVIMTIIMCPDDFSSRQDVVWQWSDQIAHLEMP